MTTQDIIAVNINSGASTNSISKTVLNGAIIGIMVYHNIAVADTFRVRAAVKDGGSNELIKLQNIKNFRSRECGYKESFLPLVTDGGRQLTIDVVADGNFSANTNFDFIFVYADDNTTPDNFTKQAPQAQSFANPASNWMAQKC